MFFLFLIHIRVIFIKFLQNVIVYLIIGNQGIRIFSTCFVVDAIQVSIIFNIFCIQTQLNSIYYLFHLQHVVFSPLKRHILQRYHQLQDFVLIQFQRRIVFLPSVQIWCFVVVNLVSWSSFYFINPINVKHLWYCLNIFAIFRFLQDVLLIIVLQIEVFKYVWCI